MGNALCVPQTAEEGKVEVAVPPLEREGSLLLNYVSKDAYATARTSNTAFLEGNRVGHSKFIKGPIPEERPLQLLKATVSSVVFSAEVEDFRFWVEDRANNVNDLLDQPVATSSSDRQALVSKYMQYQDIWMWLKETSACLCFTHPTLGQTPVTGTLLHSCVMYRGTGSGNGEGSSPDPVFEYLLSHGANPNIPDSLGITPLQLAIAAFFSRLDGSDTALDDYTVKGLSQTITLVGMMLGYGADPKQKLQPFNSMDLRVYCNAAYAKFEAVLQGSRALDTAGLLELWAPQAGTAGTWQAELTQQLREAVQGGTPVPAAVHGQPDSSSTPWAMAVYQIVWALSQLLREPAGRARRAVLRHMTATAPFVLQPMRLVPLQQLREAGAIPRLSTAEPSTLGVSLEISEIPEDGVAVFVSHRWLGGNQPDDAQGNKYRQVMAAMDQLVALQGLEPSRIYCWLDYACVDQANPMPGVQALPMFLACCDLFVYLEHPQYMQRAWCLTEQYIYHKLTKGAARYYLDAGGKVAVQPYTRPPADPALGKIFDEKDRLALASMTAILRDPDATS